MNCPECGSPDDKVTTTRDYGDIIERHRKCATCKVPWTTVELRGRTRMKKGNITGVELSDYEIASTISRPDSGVQEQY